jgi:hypothetical protein
MFLERINIIRGKKMKLGVGIAGIVLSLGLVCGAPHLDRETYTARVTEKTVKRYDDDDKYLLFTKLVEDNKVRVFENTDSWLELKRNSSNIWGELEEGKTYEIKTYGFRAPVFSWYENILEVKEVSTPADSTK